jgi:rubredoxin
MGWLFDSFLLVIEKPLTYVIIFNVYLRFATPRGFMSEHNEQSIETTDETDKIETVDTQELDRYECRSCGYVYEPMKGDDKREIPSGTAFEELNLTWRCPVCGAKKVAFISIGPASQASGFKENLSYGFGVNKMTPTQKNLLIFGALGIGFLFFLSLYGLQ